MADVFVYLAAGVVFGVLSAALFAIARWVELTTTSGSWQFSVFGLQVAAGLLLCAALILFFSFNVLATFMVAATVFMYEFARWRMAREGLVWVMALTTTRGLPLAPSIHAFAVECSGLYRYRVLRFARRLRGGMELSAALARDRGIFSGLLPRDGAAAVCIGCACGDLPGALLNAAKTTVKRRPVWNELGARLIYLLQVILVIGFVTTGFMYFIMPAYIKIFEDFDADLPEITQQLIRISVFIGEDFFTLLFLGLMALAIFAGVFYLLVQGNWFGFGRLLRDLHLPPLMRALAGVVERGQPLPTALAALAKSYPSLGVRRKLRRVNESIQKGGGDWRPFAEQGLITRADAAVLDAAARLGNLPWAMRALADGQERRRGYRLQVGLQILWPVTIVLIALVVGFIVVSAFVPLVGLIDKLA